MKNAYLLVHGKRAGDLKIHQFSDAMNMTDWEMAAYDAYTVRRCHADGIETLKDLFGIHFSDAFVSYKNLLIDRETLRELIKARDALNVKIRALEFKLQ